MAIPVLKLNLVPRPTLWRLNHLAIGWGALVLGVLAFAGVAMLTAKAYYDARKAGNEAVALTAQARKAAREEADLQDELRRIDVTAEQPRWRLAERILSERSIPWSRVTAELERSSVQDVRFKSIQRVRGQGNQGVLVKLKLECRNREAEVAFVQSIQQNPFFQGVIFEREVERQGGGLEVEATLPVSDTLPAYQPLPLYGPSRKPESVVAAPPPKVLPLNPRAKGPVPVKAPPVMASQAAKALPDPRADRTRPETTRRTRELSRPTPDPAIQRERR